MRTPSLSAPGFFQLAILLNVGCGASQVAPIAPTSPTSVTAAEVSSRPEESPEPSTRAVEPSAASAPSGEPAEPAETPPGQLACKTSSHTEGTTELFLEWTGDEAKGVFRVVTPSGMIHVQRVHAERHGRMIVADDVNETDLVVHTATVRQHEGKPYLRLGTQPWQPCEQPAPARE